MEIVRAGRTMETRWPCPVCLGAKMEKRTARGLSTAVTLDVCMRCGGIWFERGEMRQLAAQSPESLWCEVPRRTETVRPPCHGCGAPLHRDAERCAVCGRRNVLHCPRCDLQMERRAQGDLMLDLCRRCDGVWFDHVELEGLWRLSLLAATARIHTPSQGAGSAAGNAIVESLVYAPDLVVHGASAAVQVTSAAVESIGSAALGGAAEAGVHAAGAAAELIGHAAEGVFTLIAEIIGGLFDV
jgi:Zn-finger nucleic acid-binding protein